MARYDDLNTSAIAYTTFVSTIILLIIILLGRALCYAWIETEDERKLAESHYVNSDLAIGEQKAMLSGYNRVQVEVPPLPAADGQAVDGEPQPAYVERVHIPIEKAKELLFQDLSVEPSA